MSLKNYSLIQNYYRLIRNKVGGMSVEEIIKILIFVVVLFIVVYFGSQILLGKGGELMEKVSSLFKFGS